MKSKVKKDNPRKAELMSLSADMKAYRRKKFYSAASQEEKMYWATVTINDLILSLYYQRSGTKDFRTFADWQSAGYKVKKGEKGWIIWARKRPASYKVETNDGEDERQFDFFPTCYLFNNNQVEQFKNVVCVE